MLCDQEIIFFKPNCDAQKETIFFYLFVDSGKDILEGVLWLRAHGFKKACCPGMVVVACQKIILCNTSFKEIKKYND